ncbi:hypothetical protein [Gloeobacter kilaueensis]|uniref:Uncharacterized protein n=1 Tax=Gloeobacter kilaueensis (strain ATCC BAA-2537 / CCAP 1431/1 / ULC 316 / JS1) TaxID=1183438 RepID=U5QC01_GLOK1|nr:hypothetical protein [Gloeobacter kilaueensis]AGY56338.1 hypothetical protein GKIL_0091 [Gloeobacter kilaueensis JS1]
MKTSFSWALLLRSQRYWAAGLVVVIGVAAGSVGVAARADVLQDILTSDPAVDMVDEEFDQTNDQFAWVESTSRGKGPLWLGKVDPKTGEFVPPTGKALQVDTDALTLPKVFNGAEWAFANNDSLGNAIVYTKSTDKDKALGVATFDGNVWTPSVLANSTGSQGPIGSRDNNDTAPRIFYFNTDPLTKQKVAKWREIYNPATEAVVPNVDPPGGRWVEGLRAVIYPTQLSRKEKQIFIYYVDTGVSEQVTFDAGEKITPFMWKAPEFGDDYLVMTVIDNVSVGIYRKLNGSWQQINNLLIPSTSKPYVSSSEPFTYNGKSYLFGLSQDDPNPKSLSALSDVWVAAIDPANPYYAKVSDSTDQKRRDPEVYITCQGPYIYFQRPNPSDSSKSSIYRVPASLGIPREPPPRCN